MAACGVALGCLAAAPASSLTPRRPMVGVQSVAVQRSQKNVKQRIDSRHGDCGVFCCSSEDLNDGSARVCEAANQGSKRRQFLSQAASTALISLSQSMPFMQNAFADEGPTTSSPASALSNLTDMPALRGKDYGKTRMRYPDYVETPTGLQYKDLKDGTGDAPNPGDTVVIDWDGFTIGYYGRIFEARNKAKGGSFEGSEKDFFRFRLGAGEVIPAFEEALATMRVGSIRRIIVPPELGYPNNDFNTSGPKPITFSGQRALDFVLKNQGLIDKTLLFDIELLRIIPSSG